MVKCTNVIEYDVIKHKSIIDTQNKHMIGVQALINPLMNILRLNADINWAEKS